MLNVILLGLTSLLADFSSEMVFPILPFFIQTLGGAGVAIGLAFGIGDAVSAVFKVISGRWADKTKKYRTFVFAGYAFSAVAKFLYPLSSSWQQILAVRPIERIGKGFRNAPRDAILSESLSHERRGRGFGIQRAMDSAGAVLGAAAVLIFVFYLELDFSRIFWISAIIALFAVIPILFVKVPTQLKIASKSIGFNGLSVQLKKFIFVATVFAFANFSYAFLVLQTQSLFGDLDYKKALSLTLLLYIFFSIFDSGFSTIAGVWSDKFGRRKVIILSYILLAVVFLGFGTVSLWQYDRTWTFIFLLILFALYGLFRATVDVGQKSFVSDLSDVGIRGTALGTFETFTGLAAIPAGLIAGVLWNVNQALPFFYGLMLSLTAVALFSQMIGKKSA
ncbi:MAG: MFS transporter [Candidatus Yanofskybacteria bacterium]|nr:MFS transporter [Candidatus Yanofskybacteria bacterium]